MTTSTRPLAALILLSLLLPMPRIAAETLEQQAESLILKQFAGNARVSIPFLKDGQAVSIDGNLTPHEWDGAAALAGFSKPGGKLIPARPGQVMLQRDADFLYLAVRTATPNNDPGGSLVSQARERDGKVFEDDSVEIWLAAGNQPDTLYQLVLNSLGTLYDCRRSADGRIADAAWNLTGFRTASTVDNGWWNLEAALPLNQLGNPQKNLRLNVARNWSGFGSSLITPANKYADVANMLHVSWENPGAVLRQTDTGNTAEGEWAVTLQGLNQTPIPLAIATLLRHFSYPKDAAGKPVKTEHRDIFNVLPVPPGTRASLDARHDASGQENYYFAAILFDPATGKVLASRTSQGSRTASTSRHPASADFQLPGLGAGACWYYPTYNRAVLRFSPHASLTAARVGVARNGTLLGQAERLRQTFEIPFAVPATAGEHTFDLIIEPGPQQQQITAAFKLEKIIFPWQTHPVATEPLVIPPFKPLQADGNRVQNLLSTVLVNASGLWDSLQAESVELLADPMRVELTANGKPQAWSDARVSPPAVEDNGHALRFQTSARSANGITLNANLNFEFDGFNWITMSLDGIAGHTIDAIKLVIPLRDSEHPLFHAVSNFIRENPSGRLPAGDGPVWDGTRLPRRTALGEETMHPQMVPYLWLGGPRRGLSFFIDCTDGFRLDRQKSAVRISRQAGVLTLEIDVINRPVQLDNGHQFAFGLMPTPVKPVDPALRRYTHDSAGLGARNMPNFTFIGGQLLGYIPWLRQPLGQDYRLFAAVCQAVRDGGANLAAKPLDDWLAAWDEPVKKLMASVPGAGDYPAHYSRVRVNFRKHQLDDPARRPALPYKYGDPRLTFIHEDIPEYFRAEWYNPAPQNYFGARRVSLTPSQIDFLLHGFQREFENGMHGVYLDDVYIIPDTNPHTLARIDAEGTLHPSMGILAIRNLVKRVATLQHQHNLTPRLLQVHMTNALLIPCFSLATSTLGWEQHYGESPLTRRFAIDDILATGTGQQLGAEACVLGGIKKVDTPSAQWPERNRQLTRSLLALSLPFAAKFKAPVTPAGDAPYYFSIISLMSDFGFWADDCRFVPFWETDAAAIRASQPNWLVSSWRRPGQLLAVLGNTGDAASGSLQLDLHALGFTPNATWTHLETGEPVNPTRITIADDDFLLLRLAEPQPRP